MSEPETPERERSMDSLASGEDRSLDAWRWVWEGDRGFPVTSHRGVLGKIIVAFKRLFRGFVRAPQADLWERQRAYNLLIQDYLERAGVFEAEVGRRLADQAGVTQQVAATADGVGRDLQTVQTELSRDLVLAQEAQARDQLLIQEDVKKAKDELWNYLESQWSYLESQNKRLEVLEGFHNDGWDDVRDHTAALFSRLDQKLDRYRRLSRERWDRLGALLEVAQEGGAPALARAVDEEKYVEFEGLFRGRQEEIRERLAPYLPILQGRGSVLDLGCGRGEALAVLAEHGLDCRGVDSSTEMVKLCREKGLQAEVDDVFSALADVEEGSLGAIISFHVIEHLPATALDRLVRLAWRGVAPGGVLVFETPSPLSLVVGARNFWIDPTHARPVHPESLKAIFEINGFDPVERIDLQPFSDDLRLPEIATAGLDGELLKLAEQINALRDSLDDLLYGFQDYGMIGYKPR